jgi:hypothetical protein
MQWYVLLVTISAVALLTWLALELFGRPIRELVELRRSVLKQIGAFGKVSLPRPREMATSSQEIREYDQAIKSARDAQRIFSDLGCQLLAFGENERFLCIAIGLFGLNIIVAGRKLIDLSGSYLRSEIDRTGLREHVEKALFIDSADFATSHQIQRNELIQFQTETMRLRDIGLSS